VRFGVVLPTLTGDAARVLRVARRAEELGYDGVFVPDHLGSGAGPLPLEAFATLAAVAATTPRVRVGTLVARATLRPVAVLARMVAAVDAMSHGRLVLGIGAGDASSAGEDAAAGLPSLDADARRATLAETVDAVQALLAGEPWPGGAHVRAVTGALAPAASRVPEIWVGGGSSAVVRIATDRGLGWNGWGLGAERFETTARAVAAAGGDATWGGVVAVAPTPAALEELLHRRRTAGLAAPDAMGMPADLRVWVDGLAAAGVTWVVAVIGGGEAGLETFAREVAGR
jgi:alkanesulfonate monooxygenase SsuD/methylene tetrahydromethanopterin reductase-like flavin-dependent oxidoreductase (luciferase family)